MPPPEVVRQLSEKARSIQEQAVVCLQYALSVSLYNAVYSVNSCVNKGG